ncbi:MAG: hypothetical protein WD066_02640 [Planctomycetaceae bacterium]
MPTSSTRWIAGGAIAILSVSAWGAADRADKFESPAKSDAAAEEKPAETVRALTAKTPIDSLQQFESGVLTTAEEIEKAVGKATAEELAKQVDFGKESVVLFAFTTGGPPFGEPKNEVKKEGDKEWIEFYVQEPDAPVRGRALKIGRSFFAVPKGSEVKFAKNRNG